MEVEKVAMLVILVDSKQCGSLLKIILSFLNSQELKIPIFNQLKILVKSVQKNRKY